MTPYLLLILLLFSGVLVGQVDSVGENKGKPLGLESPYFKRCRNSKYGRVKCTHLKIRKHILKKFKVPKKYRNDSIVGRIVVQFIIDTLGYVTEVSVVKGINPELDKEAIRATESLPRFIPGRNEYGEKKKVKLQFPITISYD